MNKREITSKLRDAAAGGDLTLVKELLQHGANPDVDIPVYGPCLHFVVKAGNLGLVHALAASGANLDRRGLVTIGEFREERVQSGPNYGNLIVHTPSAAHEATPLIVAVRCNNPEVARLLIEAGADLEATDAAGYSALQWALRLKHEEMANLLRSYHAKEPQDLEGSPLNRLFNGTAFGDLEKIRSAIAAGADINSLVEKQGKLYTPLMRAARAGRPEILQALLTAGADPNLGGSKNGMVGVTPLMIAARLGHRQVVEILLATGADPKARGQAAPAPHGMETFKIVLFSGSRSVPRYAVRAV